MTEMMHAVGYRKPAPISDLASLEDAEVPVPEPGPRDLRVQVKAVSVNPADAPRIANLGQWRQHVLGRVRRQADRTGDAFLGELFEELRGYPGDGTGAYDSGPAGANDVVVPLRIRLGGDELSFLSTTTVFGSPLDITVAELAIESFYPLDGHTAAAMRALAPAGRVAGKRLCARDRPSRDVSAMSRSCEVNGMRHPGEHRRLPAGAL